MKKNIILLLLFICIVNACTISNRSKNSVEHKINPIIFIPSEKIKENKMWIIEDSTILDTIEIIFNIYIKFDTTFFPQYYANYEIYNFNFLRIKCQSENIPDKEILQKIICKELKKEWNLCLEFNSIEEFKELYNRNTAIYTFRIIIIPPNKQPVRV